MLHLMKYRLRCLLREKLTMFWALIFPILLGTLFYAAFGKINESVDTIPVAVVEKSDSEAAKMFDTFLDGLKEADSDLLSVKVMSEKEAKNKLEKEKVAGIYYIDDEPWLQVAGSGIQESVLQSVLDTYTGKKNIVDTLIKEKPEQVNAFLASLSEETTQSSFVKEVGLGGKTEDGMVQYFFALVSMACLFAAFLGEEAVVKLQANVEPVGARRCVSATSKIKMILADMLTVALVSITSVVILYVYLIGVLGIDMGNEYGKLLLVGVFGSLIGVSIGVFFGGIGKWGEGTKSGVIILVTLGSSFLSGLMVESIKGMIEESCPIINRINPASLITDAIYSIAVYPDPDRFMRNIITMGIMTVVCLVGSFLVLRRVRYDSI